MTSDQKKAYEWAKNQNYPSVAARYAKELAGLVDELQIASCARQEQERNAPLTLDELRQMDGEPVWVQFLHNKIGYWYLIDCHNSEFIRFYRSGFFIIGEYSKNFLAYRRKPEEGTD